MVPKTAVLVPAMASPPQLSIPAFKSQDSRLTPVGIRIAANKAQSRADDGAEASRLVDPTYLEVSLTGGQLTLT